MQEALSIAPQLAASPIAEILWLIPAVPMAAAGLSALLKQSVRKTSASLAIGSLSFSLLLSLVAFVHVLSDWMAGIATREVVNLTWIQFGTSNVDLGWVLDPLSAIMLVMVSFVGLLIFRSDGRHCNARGCQSHLDSIRHIECRPWLGPRSALGHHAGNGQLCRPAHLQI